MIKTKIYVRRDPRLGRHVIHDDRSRRFAFNTSGLTIKTISHERFIPILNQGMKGKCTAEAAIGCLATDPLFQSVPAKRKYPLDDIGSDKLYCDEQIMQGDSCNEDNGSCGLTSAKCLLNAGLIDSYEHTFSLDDALKVLSIRPISIGVPWYSDMFNPDENGMINITGNLSGGHQFEGIACDAENRLVKCANSWGSGWGKDGFFFLTFDQLGNLLQQDGDVTIFNPAIQKPKSIFKKLFGWI